MAKSADFLFYRLTPIGIIAGVICLTVAGFWGALDSKSHKEKGYTAYTQGHNIEAIRELSRAQQLCETDLFTRYYLGAAYHDYGWHDEALHQYESAATLAIEIGTRSLHSAGRIHMYRGELLQAAELFQQALTLQSSAAEILYDLGLVRLQQKDFPAAERLFSEAVNHAPDNQLYRKELLDVALMNRKSQRREQPEDH